MLVRQYVPTFPRSHVPTFRTCNVTLSCDLPLVPWFDWCERLLCSVPHTLCLCWNYKVMRSQRSYLEGSIDDRDDADDEYLLISDAVDAVDVCLDCMQS